MSNLKTSARIGR